MQIRKHQTLFAFKTTKSQSVNPGTRPSHSPFSRTAGSGSQLLTDRPLPAHAIRSKPIPYVPNVRSRRRCSRSDGTHPYYLNIFQKVCFLHLKNNNLNKTKQKKKKKMLFLATLVLYQIRSKKSRKELSGVSQQGSEVSKFNVPIFRSSGEIDRIGFLESVGS